MRRLALVVLLVSFEFVVMASASNAAAGPAGSAMQGDSLAPPSQWVSGDANASDCLNRTSTSRPCSGIPGGITYATTALNWTQTVSNILTGGTEEKVTLGPCPIGIDTTSGAGYQVFISGGGKSEAVNVVSGTCIPGAPSGTITFIPYHSYPTGSTIGSASSGIQESINAACGASPSYNYNGQCNVTIPANGPYLGSGGRWSVNNYFVHGTIFFHSNQSVLDGSGVSLFCEERGPCLQMGDLVNTNHYTNNAVRGLSFRSPTNVSLIPAYAGLVVTSTSATGGYGTTTTATAHGFRPGDIVTTLFTDNPTFWGDAIVKDCGSGTHAAACTSSSTTFRYGHSGNIDLQSTPGVVALAYEAILDNADATHFTDIQYDVGGELGHFNNFFDMWDDENATIDHFNNNAIGLNNSDKWMGSFLFSGGASNIGHQLAPVITLRDSNITANYSSGITDYNSNGLYIENTVIQASGLWQVYSSNVAGNYQGAYLKNIYSESSLSANSLSPIRSPFPGTGIAGLIAGPSTAAANFEVAGSGVTQGAFQTGGSGLIAFTYYIVANDRTARTQTSPMQVLNWKSTGNDSPVLRWPRVANGTDIIAYDVIRMATPVGVGATFPYVGGCDGGSGGACGSVVTSLSQTAACSGGLVCTYTDSGSSVTSPYTIRQGTYSGNLSFWPGSLVSVNRSVTVDVELGNVVGLGLFGNPLQIANQCTGYGAASPGGYTACSASVTSANNSVPNQTATIITDGDANTGGNQTATKGRLNFSTTPFTSIQPHHIITLIDSQPALTQATSGYRPPASANDTWIGTDVSRGGVGLNSGQLAFGAPVSITNYIRATGDSVDPNWLERLTSKQKTFAVPVKISEGNSFTLGDGSPLSQMKIYRVNRIPASRVPAQSCVDIVVDAKGLTKSDQIASVSPPGKLGNLSVNAYAADEGVVVLHFCNPSTFEVVTPLGAYSFLAVR
jgi:hypothetical protein